MTALATEARRVAPRLYAAQDYERWEQRQLERWNAHCYLTVVNAPFVLERLKRLLVGKMYTFVAVNENMDLLHPEVRTGQRLQDGPGHWTDGARDGGIRLSMEPLSDGRPFAHIMAGDTYGVWGMTTTLRDIAEVHAYQRARNGAVGFHHMSDPDLKGKDYDVAYLVFHGDRDVEIYQRTGAGGRITWTIVVEPGQEDDDG